MNKFENIEVGHEIYSIVFGIGKVNFVLAKSLRLDGYYIFEVTYNNGQKVWYTEEGQPDWCQEKNACTKTILFKDEITIDDIDTTPPKKLLKKKKILKLHLEDNLEMKSPAGAWIDSSLMPDILFDNAINNKEYHLFRERITSE